MKYLSVLEWILGEEIYYDFVEDTIGDIDSLNLYKQLPNVFEKFFSYRAEMYEKEHDELLNETYKKTVEIFVQNAKNYKTNDPDQFSNLLRKIYIHLWGEVFLVNYCNCSDTMTSAQTLLSKCIECSRKRDDFRKIYKGEKIVRVTKNSSIAMAACNEQIGLYEALGEEFPQLGRFLSLYHTIGNYVPVPEGFNLPRSNAGKKDFWDLTLMYIHKYYMSDNIEEKKTIVKCQLLNNHKKSNPTNVILWLSRYGEGKKGWEEFIRFNFFHDYVDEDYEVVPFWEGHGDNNLLLPTDSEALNTGLETICGLIEKRGQRIVDTIKMTDCYTFHFGNS